MMTRRVRGGVLTPTEISRIADGVVLTTTPDGSGSAIQFPGNQITVTPSGALKVSQLTTLGDYKNLNEVNLLFEQATNGTGAIGAISDNRVPMTVAADGDYAILQARRRLPYFSGKVQTVEQTADGFAPQANVTKRMGYFSSNTSGPFNSDLDGMWLESSGGTIALNVYRNGTAVLDALDITEWSGYADLGVYQTLANWDNFTVSEFDFLWLGGALMQFWLVVPGSGFVLAHQFDYAGTDSNVFTQSPNQPFRVEIRSSGGAGSMNYICAQVSTGGSISESGVTRGVDTGSTAITMAAIGTRYPLKGVRKKTTHLDVAVEIVELSLLVSSNNDLLLWTLETNPTLSDTPSWSNVANHAIQQASGDGTIVVSTPGDIIASGYFSQDAILPSGQLKENFKSFIGNSLAGASDEIWLCVEPITASVNSFGGIIIKQF